MKKLILVLACYGLMVSSAAAGERWPAKQCADVAAMKAFVEKGATPNNKVWLRFPLLLIQRDYCGVDVKAQLDADIASVQREADEAAADLARTEHRRHAAPAPRQPMNCLSVPMIGGAVATGCN